MPLINALDRSMVTLCVQAHAMASSGPRPKVTGSKAMAGSTGQVWQLRYLNGVRGPQFFLGRRLQKAVEAVNRRAARSPSLLASRIAEYVTTVAKPSCEIIERHEDLSNDLPLGTEWQLGLKSHKLPSPFRDAIGDVTGASDIVRQHAQSDHSTAVLECAC